MREQICIYKIKKNRFGEPIIMYYIYILYSSLEETPFYVGQTTQKLEDRLEEHIYESMSFTSSNQNYKNNNPKHLKIRELLSSNYTIKIKLLDYCLNKYEALDKEKYYIKIYENLTNIVHNGDDSLYLGLNKIENKLNKQNSYFIEGNRNNYIFKLGIEAKKKKFTINEVFKYCEIKEYTTYLGKYEIEKCINSAFSYEVDNIKYKNDDLLKQKETLLYNKLQNDINIDNQLIELNDIFINIDNLRKYKGDNILLDLILDLIKLGVDIKNDKLNFIKEFNLFLFDKFSLTKNDNIIFKNNINITRIITLFLSDKLKVFNNNVFGKYWIFMNNKYTNIDDLCKTISQIMKKVYLINSFNIKIIEEVLNDFDVNIVYEDHLKDIIFKELNEMDINLANNLYNELKLFYKNKISEQNENDFFRCFEYWIYSCIKQVYELKYKNEYFLTIFAEKQGVGKSTFVNIISNYFIENNLYVVASKNLQETYRNMLSNFIIHDDEGIIRKNSDNTFIKNLLSLNYLSYDEKFKIQTEKGKRIANFISTTNNGKFLSKVESRRDLILHFKNISMNQDELKKLDLFLNDINYSKAIWGK